MTPEATSTDKMAALYLVERQRGDAMEQLNNDLYAAALRVLDSWSGGDLATAVRSLQAAVRGVDQHYDEVKVIEAGWDRQGESWVRFLAPRESADPEIDPNTLWIEGKVLHASSAAVVLQQDEFRTITATGGH